MTTRHRRRLSIVAVMVALTLVSGCSAEPDTTSVSADEGLPEFPAADSFIDCMAQSGWEAWRDIDGIQVVDPPIEQQDQFRADDASCADESGLAALDDPSQWSPAKQQELYEQEVANHACLIAMGRPSAEPPSLETYLDTLGTVDQYQAITEYGSTFSSIAEYDDTLRACPPPLWFITIDGVAGGV